MRIFFFGIPMLAFLLSLGCASRVTGTKEIGATEDPADDAADDGDDTSAGGGDDKSGDDDGDDNGGSGALKAPAISYAGSPFSFSAGTALPAPIVAKNKGGTAASCRTTPALPAGLTISKICTISGEPTQPSPATSYAITATNAAGTSPAATISITVAIGVPTLQAIDVKSGTIRTALIKGTATPQTTVNIYKTSDCSGAPAVSGPAETFNSTGLEYVFEKSELVQKFYVKSTKTFGATTLSTACSSTPIEIFRPSVEVITGLKFSDGSSDPEEFAQLGTSVFFEATHPTFGKEITELKADGTIKIYDLQPGSGANVNTPITVGDSIYFAGDNGTAGWELHRIRNGVLTSFDLNPGISGSFPNTYDGWAAVGNTLFIFAASAATGEEVFEIDNTEDTFTVHDLTPGTGDTNYEYDMMVSTPTSAYFVLDTPAYSSEVWRFKPGVAPLVFDAYPGGSDGAYPWDMTSVGETIYYVGYGVAYDGELYRIENENDTTAEFIDIEAGAGDSYPEGWANANGVLYFIATTAANGKEIYRIANSTAAPVLLDVVAGATGSNPDTLTAVDDAAYFMATTAATGREVFRIKNAGSVIEPLEVVAGAGGSSPDNYRGFNLNGYFIWKATDAALGRELFRINNAGTVPSIIDMTVGATGTNPSVMFNDPPLQQTGYDHMYVTATIAPNPSAIYRVSNDGTFAPLLDEFGNAVTSLSWEFQAGSGNIYANAGEVGVIDMDTNVMTYANIDDHPTDPAINKIGSIYWTGSRTAANPNNNLFAIDGKDFTEVDLTGFTIMNTPINVGGVGYAVGSSPATGTEIFRFDSPTAAPVAIDIEAGATGSDPYYLTEVAGQLFFSAMTAANGREIYRIASLGATPELFDIRTGVASSTPSALRAADNYIVFSATDNTPRVHLHRIDPATGIVTEFAVKTTASSSPASYYFERANKIYFLATGDNGTELFRVPGPTGSVEELNIDSVVGSSNATILGFAGTEILIGATTAASGTDIFVTTDFSSVTPLDTVAGAGSSLPGVFGSPLFSDYVSKFGDTAYFNCVVTGESYELCRKKAGQPIEEIIINPGATGASIGDHKFVDGTFYFTAASGTKGRELYFINDSMAAPQILREKVGPESSHIKPIGNSDVVPFFEEAVPNGTYRILTLKDGEFKTLRTLQTALGPYDEVVAVDEFLFYITIDEDTGTATVGRW